jgi:hypothetical protein
MSKHTLYIIVMALFSCREPKNNILPNNHLDTINTERVVLYQEDSAIKADNKTLFLSNLSRLIGLPNIEKGKEGLYIRIWLWDSQKKYIINISKDGEQNKCHIVEMNSRKKDSAEYIVIHREWDVKPKAGWDSCWATIEKFKIPYLKSGKSYREWDHHLTEMAYVDFEIARPNQYRFYDYLQPEFYREVDENSRIVNDFLKYLNAEMNLNVYVPEEKLFVEPK